MEGAHNDFGQQSDRVGLLLLLGVLTDEKVLVTGLGGASRVRESFYEYRMQAAAATGSPENLNWCCPAQERLQQQQFARSTIAHREGNFLHFGYR